MRIERWLKSLVVLQAVTLGVLGAVFPFSVMPKIGFAVAVVLLFATRYRVSVWDGATLTMLIVAWGFVGGSIDLQTGHPWLVLLCLEFMLVDIVLLASAWLRSSADQRNRKPNRALFAVLCMRTSLFALLLVCTISNTALALGRVYAVEFLLSALALRTAWAGRLQAPRLLLLLGLSFGVAPAFALMADWRSCTQPATTICTYVFEADLAVIALRALLIALRSAWFAIRR
jgi:hypothetical protein